MWSTAKHIRLRTDVFGPPAVLTLQSISWFQLASASAPRASMAVPTLVLAWLSAFLGVCLPLKMLFDRRRSMRDDDRHTEPSIPTRPRPLFSPVLWWIWWLTVLATCALTARLGYLQGVVRAARVEGSSMEPRWFGPHRILRCGACRFPFRHDAVEGSRTAACPNCGAIVATQGTAVLRGDRVLIDGWQTRVFAPRRWHVVAVTADSADATSHVLIKRIVGLPGEQISIVGGDIYANGRICRKSLEELRDVAILLHDDRFQPRSHAPKFSWTSPAGEDSTPLKEAHEQWRPLSPLPFPVRDLWLHCRLRLRGRGVLWWSYDGAAGTWRVECDFAKKSWTLFDARHDACARGALASSVIPEEAVWDFALFDEQIVAAVDGREVVVYPFHDRPQRSTAPEPAWLCQLQIGTHSMEFEVRERQVYADVYYLDPHGRSGVWQAEPSASDTYFLLGDHASVSQDSRHFGGVPRGRLLGRIVDWYCGGNARHAAVSGRSPTIGRASTDRIR